MLSSHCQGSLIWWLSIGFSVFMSHSLGAAEKSGTSEASLKMNGKTVTEFGLGACKDQKDAKVEIILNDNILKAYDDFLYLLRSGNKSDTANPTCGAKIAANQSNVKTFTAQDPSIKQNDLVTKGQCDKSGSRAKNILCIYSNTGDEGELVASALFTIDTEVSKIESIADDSKTAANKVVEFTVTFTGKPKEFETCYAKADAAKNFDDSGDCKSPLKSHKQSLPKINIKGLENDVEYIFKVRTIDPSGSPGPWSSSFKLKPIPVIFPLSMYEGEGGELAWSCQSSGPLSLGFLLMLLALMLSLRLRHLAKSTLMPLMLAVFFLVPAENSHADFGQFSLGLIGSMYRPDLDSEKLSDGSSIFPFYKSFFRKSTSDENGPINPLMGVEIDMHLFDGYGSLQLGLGLGYTFATGQALGIKTDGMPDSEKIVSSVKTSLHMYQLRPQLTYMLDYFKDYFPLFPYARAAAIIHGYSFSNSIETDDTFKHKPNGFRFGYQGAAGLMLMLDFLEPGSIRSASSTLKHVYLKGELSYTKIDTFGKNGFQFSAKDIMGSSMPLMWTFGLVFDLP